MERREKKEDFQEKEANFTFFLKVKDSLSPRVFKDELEG